MFPLGFADIHQHRGHQDDQGADNLAATPAFDVYEKVKFNQGLFVSNSGVATETFFHHIEPSKKIRVYLNPTVEQSNLVERSGEVRDRVSFFGKLKAFIRNGLVGIKKSLRPCRGHFMGNGSVNKLFHVISVVLASYVYVVEVKEMDTLSKEICSEDQVVDGKLVKKIKKLGRNK